MRVVEKHPEDTDTLALLVETVSMLGNLATVLPTRSEFPPLEPEDLPSESGDEVALDPALLNRPLG